jgi:hypothetical protein
MENVFPRALVDRIAGLGREDVTAEFVQIGGVRMDRASRLRRGRRSHLARHPLLPRVAQDSRTRRCLHRQQPVLVQRRRQVLQLRSGRPDRRGGAADGGAAAQGTPGRHDRPVDAQPDLPAELGRDLRLRGLSRVPEALRRRRLARRLRGAIARGVCPRVRPDARSLHDAPGRRPLQGVLPVLRGGPGAGADHAVRPARAVPRALPEAPARVRPRARRAR